MYERFFGLDERPFNVTPDPRYLYFTEGHREALAHLLYGVQERKGFVLLTGEVGTGKTTLVRAFLEQVGDEVKTALVLHSRAGFLEILSQACADFGLSVKGRGKVSLLAELNRFLLEAFDRGDNAAVIIDEAQNLSVSALEEIRLLSNLETSRAKLLQVVLVGQPELEATLDRPELRQLRQRIGLRCRLSPLDRDETRAYVRRRLEVAKAPPSLFSEGALNELYRRSRGTPRLINLLGDNALLSAYAEGRRDVSRLFVREAARDLRLMGEKGLKGSRSRVATFLAGLSVAGFLVGSGLHLLQPFGSLSKPPASALTPILSHPRGGKPDGFPPRAGEKEAKGEKRRFPSPIPQEGQVKSPPLPKGHLPSPPLPTGDLPSPPLAKGGGGGIGSPLLSQVGLVTSDEPSGLRKTVERPPQWGPEKTGYKPRVIRRVQEVLREQRLYAGEITGRLDEATASAIEAFQRANGLAPTGIPGPRTRAVLGPIFTPELKAQSSR